MDTGNNQTEDKPLAGRDDYLWDGSGEPDPEIQRLEALLGRFHMTVLPRYFPTSPPIDDGHSFRGGCDLFPF